MSDQITWVGDRVRKTDGYTFEGVVLAAFSNSKGQPRLVVEHDDGWLFIFNPEQIEPVPPKQCSYAGAHFAHDLCPGVQP